MRIGSRLPSGSAVPVTLFMLKRMTGGGVNPSTPENRRNGVVGGRSAAAPRALLFWDEEEELPRFEDPDEKMKRTMKMQRRAPTAKVRGLALLKRTEPMRRAMRGGGRWSHGGVEVTTRGAVQLRGIDGRWVCGEWGQ